MKCRKPTPAELLEGCIQLAIQQSGPGKTTLEYLKRARVLYGQALIELDEHKKPSK
jgi:hypothetical protein